jgi:hypothetical protein
LRRSSGFPEAEKQEGGAKNEQAMSQQRGDSDVSVILQGLSPLNGFETYQQEPETPNCENKQIVAKMQKTPLRIPRQPLMRIVMACECSHHTEIINAVCGQSIEDLCGACRQHREKDQSKNKKASHWCILQFTSGRFPMLDIL